MSDEAAETFSDPKASFVPGPASSVRKVFEGCIQYLLFLCAAISVLTTIGIVVVLLTEALQFFGDVSPWTFLFGTKWSPLLKPQHFGILPLLCGTCLVAAGEALVAIPIGLCTAIYLSEYAPKIVREIVKPLL